jgi:outer membrane protein OmpA-like peptidoglycan-associated protein
MARNWTKLGGLLALGLMVAPGLLAGCGVNEKDFNALKQENEDLRSKMAALETDKNAALARQQEEQAAATATTQGGATIRGGGKTQRSSGNQDVVLEIAGDVLFDPGQATVKSSAKKELDRIVSQLNGKYSGHNVRVEGHTDSDPPKKMKAKYPTNEALSEARAQAVREYLVAKGVTGRRVTTVGLGDSRPKGSKKDSRRVDIVVLAD